MKKSKDLLFLAASTAFVLFSVVLFSSSSGRLRQTAASFTECINLQGSIIQESYPEVCVTKEGLSFTRELTDQEKVQLGLDEDADTDVSCGLFYHYGEEIAACASCGDGLCDPYESCTPSSLSEELSTADCGPLYCPQDCEEE